MKDLDGAYLDYVGVVAEEDIDLCDDTVYKDSHGNDVPREHLTDSYRLKRDSINLKYQRNMGAAKSPQEREGLRAEYEGQMRFLEIEMNVFGLSFDNRIEPRGKDFIFIQELNAGVPNPRNWVRREVLARSKLIDRALEIADEVERLTGITLTKSDKFEMFLQTPWKDVYRDILGKLRPNALCRRELFDTIGQFSTDDDWIKSVDRFQRNEKRRQARLDDYLNLCGWWDFPLLEGGMQVGSLVVDFVARTRCRVEGIEFYEMKSPRAVQLRTLLPKGRICSKIELEGAFDYFRKRYPGFDFAEAIPPSKQRQAV